MSDDLAAFLLAINTVEHADDPVYLEAVERLRHDPSARVREIEDLSQRLAGRAHALRRGLLMAAAVAEVPESVRFLRSVAMQPVTRTNVTGDGQPPCMQSRLVTAEEALRVRAVEGLEMLARSGVPDAVEALAGAVEASSLTVRAVSLAALNDVEGASEARERSVARLAPEDRYLADLRRVDVRDAGSVADPQRHLAHPGREDRPVPRLDSQEPWPASGRPTPRLRKAGSDG